MKRKKVIVFIILVYLLSGIIAAGFYLAGVNYLANAQLIGTIYMFIPLVAVVIVQKLIYQQDLLAYCGINFKINRWWLVAWLLPGFIALLTFLVSLLLPSLSYAPYLEGVIARFQGSQTELNQLKQLQEIDYIFLINILQWLVYGVTINAVVAFGEELAWRGFLWQELQDLNFWLRSLMIGFFWGLWHGPLIVQGHAYLNYPISGVLIFTIFCILLSPIFDLLRNLTDSVLAVSILHGSLNASYGLASFYITGGNELIVGMTGLSGLIALAILNLAILSFLNLN